jgi:hypothetical protein
VARGTAARLGVDLDRPAFEDLEPRSAHYRRIATLPVPRTVSSYVFWGDVTLHLRPLGEGFPAASLEAGDLLVLEGDPDPAALPELGGQRYGPKDLAEGAEALEIPHRAEVTLAPDDVADIVGACAIPGGAECADAVGERFDLPNSHGNVPTSMTEITVGDPQLGGPMSLEDAVSAVVRRGP